MATEKRLIDANALIRKSIAVQAPRTSLTLLPWQQWMDTVHAVLVTNIMSAPTVDAVEVVRCKDCKYWNVHPINGKLTLGKCVKLSRVMADTWFCSYGERKDNE